MFKWIARKQLRRNYTETKLFFDTQPQLRSSLAMIFTKEFEILFSGANLGELGNESRYFKSKFTEFHSKLSGADLKRLHLQVFNYNIKLREKYGITAETTANGFLASFLLSMVMIQPNKQENPLDAMSRGADGEIYSAYSTVASELIDLERQSLMNAK